MAALINLHGIVATDSWGVVSDDEGLNAHARSTLYLLSLKLRVLKR